MPQTETEYRAAWVRALLEERAVCEARGKTDRVQQIDAELRRFGQDAEPPARRATKRVRKGDE